MEKRYDIRKDREGWTVFDQWTGEEVAIALTPQTGLHQDDATQLADLMNLRNREDGGRQIWQ